MEGASAAGFALHRRTAEKVTGPRSYFPSIEKKYGQPIASWMTALDAVRGQKHTEQVKWLQTQHGLGHGHANALVHVYRAEHPA